MSDFLYEEGDEFQGPAAYMSKFIRQVKLAGGEVKIVGDRAIITHLPSKPVSPKPVIKETVIVPEPEAEPEPDPEPEPEPEAEPVVEIEEVETPKRRRSRKFVTEEADETEE